MPSTNPFHVGIATASYHIEGNIHSADWTEFEKKHFVNESERSGLAINYWNTWEKDHEYLSDLGVNIYRTSLDWSRIEPKEGAYDTKAIEQYKKILTDLKKRKIKTVITLFHYVLPDWFAKKGGFTKKENLIYFEMFVTKILSEFEGYIDYVIPVNEILVYSFLSYFTGIFPPQKSDPVLFFRVVRNLIRAHFIVARILKEKKYDIKITSAEHNRKYTYGGDSFLGKIFVNLINNIAHIYVTKSLFSNRFHFPFGFFDKVEKKPYRDLDFLGLQFYPGINVLFTLENGRIKFTPADSTLTWQEALMTSPFKIDEFEEALSEMRSFNKPLFVTEIGVQTHDDTVRSTIISQIGKAISKAAKKNLNIHGILYFTLFDCFEWTEGFKQKFGLISVDRFNLKRVKKNSYMVFKKLVGGLI